MINQERIVREFMEMVTIASPTRKEGQFAQVLKSKLEAMGLEVYEDNAGKEAGSDTGNLIGRVKGNTGGLPAVIFAAHMDTVSPGEGIRPVIKDGYIYSSGDTVLGADDKAGIAAILEALRHLKEEGITHGDIEVVFTIAEEGGLFGSKYLDYSLLKGKVAFVLDSGGAPGTIINRAPAQDKLSFVIHGKAAHAGVSPEEGISAIQVAARAIDRMKLLRIDEETTANIGVIKGGSVTNIVCDRVEIEAEARSLSVEKLEKQSRHMVQCMEEACREFGARLESNVERAYNPFFVEEQDPLVLAARKAAEKLGLESRVISTGGGSDTNNFNARGIKAVNLGVGMSKVHTLDEYIPIKDLVDSARYVVSIIEEMGK
ncbi:MAG: peptidase [Peptococcaceae bacterium]|jgi:tripeptide aminopeptidase|nr:peptidase [Peptococcaceae bacterium]